jgi:hypothetical protein
MTSITVAEMADAVARAMGRQPGTVASIPFFETVSQIDA